MDDENIYTVTDLLTLAHDQKPIDFEDAFKGIMANKMMAAIDARKIEIASSLYSADEETDEAEEIETETEEQEEIPEEDTDGETA